MHLLLDCAIAPSGVSFLSPTHFQNCLFPNRGIKPQPFAQVVWTHKVVFLLSIVIFFLFIFVSISHLLSSHLSIPWLIQPPTLQIQLLVSCSATSAASVQSGSF